MKLRSSSWLRRVACSLTLTAAAHASAAPAPAALEAHAWEVLHQIMDSEQTWVRIHAAEALIAAGEVREIRADFLKRKPDFESSKIRVGMWRVLATTSPTPADRADCIAHLEQIYLTPDAPDHPQSIETLCKLGEHLRGPARDLMRSEAKGAPSTQTVLALWASVNSKESGAVSKLTAQLESPDVNLRRLAAYALRWLKLPDEKVGQALSRAAEKEPADSSAYPYLLGAAVAAPASDNLKKAGWIGKLDRVVATGTTDARFEASWTLKYFYMPADLPRIAPMLDLPAEQNDARIGAAAIILTTLARK